MIKKINEIVSLDDTQNQESNLPNITNNKNNIEKVFAYIYALMHSTIYTNKYLAEIQADYPRIIFYDSEIFYKVSELGQQLIDLHLLESKFTKNTAKIDLLSHVKNDVSKNIVEQVFYNSVEKQLHTSSSKYFSNISQGVYEYTIAEKSVLNDYLKSRIGRELSFTEIEHIIKVANSLQQAILVHQQINEALKHVV